MRGCYNQLRLRVHRETCPCATNGVIELKKTDRAIFALAAALTLLLTACGSSGAASGASFGDAVLPSPTAVAGTSTPPAETEAPVFTEPTEETGAPKVDYEKIYRPILDKVFHGITTGFVWEQDIEGLTGIIETANSSRDVNEALRYIGYAITDLSGDGVPELALGIIADEAENAGSLVSAVFTCADGQPKQCLEGWYRSRYEWMGGGRFCYSGSSGAAYTLYGDCSLSEDGTELTWNDFYFSTVTDMDSYEVRYFHNRTGVFEDDGSEEMEEDAFWAGWDALYGKVQALPMTPFSDYGDQEPFPSAPVRALWEFELPGGHADYTSVVSNSSEYAVRLAFVAEETVTDVQFLALQLEDIDASGRPVFSEETLYTQPELTPELPLVAELAFPGDLPAYGLRYTDPAGAIRFFALSQSGFDGSLKLIEY